MVLPLVTCFSQVSTSVLLHNKQQNLCSPTMCISFSPSQGCRSAEAVLLQAMG